VSSTEAFVVAAAQAMHLRHGGGVRVPTPRSLSWADTATTRDGADEAARRYVERYPRRRHRALVISDSHGSAAHLAAALDVPWLPLPPADCGLPPAYLDVFQHSLEPGAPVLVITTGRRSPGMPSPVGAVTGQARRAGLAPVAVHVPCSTLSASVAQVYRSWLIAAGKRGDRLVVECGTLLDAWHVMRAGLVPYWCPDAALRHADTLTWWLAGEQPYTSVDIMLQAPGGRLDGDSVSADALAGWVGAAQFGQQCGLVDRRSRRAQGRHAAWVLGGYPCEEPLPPPLPIAEAVRAITTG
jgi:hypothetical protein